ncbi:MAG TPA: glycosyltransferase [Pyrinomonadaceae bacterium]|jgi:glycosyltransferase involved in cell wall biosynthesis
MRESVLHLIDNFEQGGTERQAVQLVRLLHEGGRYKVRVACFKGHGVLRAEVERLGVGEIPEYPLRGFGHPKFGAQLVRFARHLRRERVRLVHAHGFYTNTFGVLGAVLAGVPARISSRRETEWMRTRAQQHLEQQVFRLSQAVVANAEAVGRQLIGAGVPASKVFTVHNGLDTARLAPKRPRAEALAHFRLPEGRRFVTIVANLHHRVKDHPTFLRAARRVRERVGEAAFVVAGEGNLHEEYRALAVELGIGADVFFTGRCESVGDLLAVSDVCVLSSTAEGFSNSILEYMAAGRPAVVTDVGGAREAIEDGRNGYVVAAGDDEALASRVAALLEDPEGARRMGEEGRRIVEEKFSCGAQLARTEALYESLLAKRPLPHAAGALRREGA